MDNKIKELIFDDSVELEELEREELTFNDLGMSIFFDKHLIDGGTEGE